jgi:hypothetical protein
MARGSRTPEGDTGENAKIVFKPKELAGSRLACLALTSGSHEQVTARLSEIARGFGRVAPIASYMPRGLREPDEAQLSRSQRLLRKEQRVALDEWWLAKGRGRAQVPTWDIAAVCEVEQGGQMRDGMLLVEAKAHDREFDLGGKRGGDADNRESIARAIKEAQTGLGGRAAGWNLTHEKHYQLCNRFAWAWKLASLKVPVILVFLGVLEAEEMFTGSRRPFASHGEWSEALRKYAKGLVPEVWGKALDVGGTPLVPLIRSVRAGFEIG